MKLEGAGFLVEMWVDARAVHATGDIPVLAGLLGSQLGSGTEKDPPTYFPEKTSVERCHHLTDS